MAVEQYGDTYEIVWLPDGSRLVTTTAEPVADDEIGFAMEFAAVGGRTTKNTRAFPLGVKAGMGFSMGG